MTLMDASGTVPATLAMPVSAVSPTTGPLDIPLRRVGMSPLRVFPIALNGKSFGDFVDAPTASAVLDAYVGEGGNFIDTADSYSEGRSEQLIGDWMRSRGNRDDLVVATKVGKSAEHPGLRARMLTDAVHASLRRLGTETIDLLYLHIDDPDVEFDETLLAVDELIRTGKVRAFGGSDHTGNRLIEARIAMAQLGVAPMVALQNQYHLLHRDEYEGGLAHVAAHQQLGVMPRFALAGGFLTGRYRHRTDFLKQERRSQVARYLNRKGLRVLASLDAIAQVHGTTVGAIALAWLMSRPNVVAPVVAASDPAQVPELAAAVRVMLTRQQATELDRVSA
jgi:aryl-alcohol dehydrogenase-like predicted oxidoreductase